MTGAGTSYPPPTIERESMLPIVCPHCFSIQDSIFYAGRATTIHCISLWPYCQRQHSLYQIRMIPKMCCAPPVLSLAVWPKTDAMYSGGCQ